MSCIIAITWQMAQFWIVCAQCIVCSGVWPGYIGWFVLLLSSWHWQPSMGSSCDCHLCSPIPDKWSEREILYVFILLLSGMCHLEDRRDEKLLKSWIIQWSLGVKYQSVTGHSQWSLTSYWDTSLWSWLEFWVNEKTQLSSFLVCGSVIYATDTNSFDIDESLVSLKQLKCHTCLKH